MALMSGSHVIMRGMYSKQLDPERKAALDALESAIQMGVFGRFYCGGGQRGRPGEVIEKMRAEEREKLQNLRGEDTFNIRPEYCA